MSIFEIMAISCCGLAIFLMIVWGIVVSKAIADYFANRTYENNKKGE